MKYTIRSPLLWLIAVVFCVGSVARAEVAAKIETIKGIQYYRIPALPKGHQASLEAVGMSWKLYNHLRWPDAHPIGSAEYNTYNREYMLLAVSDCTVSITAGATAPVHISSRPMPTPVVTAPVTSTTPAATPFNYPANGWVGKMSGINNGIAFPFRCNIFIGSGNPAVCAGTFTDSLIPIPKPSISEPSFAWFSRQAAELSEMNLEGIGLWANVLKQVDIVDQKRLDAASIELANARLTLESCKAANKTHDIFSSFDATAMHKTACATLLNPPKKRIAVTNPGGIVLWVAIPFSALLALLLWLVVAQQMNQKVEYTWGVNCTAAVSCPQSYETKTTAIATKRETPTKDLWKVSADWFVSQGTSPKKTCETTTISTKPVVFSHPMIEELKYQLLYNNNSPVVQGKAKVRTIETHPDGGWLVTSEKGEDAVVIATFLHSQRGEIRQQTSVRVVVGADLDTTAKFGWPSVRLLAA